MGRFLSDERERQASWKTATPHFSPDARPDGIYKKAPRPFCLPVETSDQNLFAGIRRSAIDYFRKSGIHWHDGCGPGPSNHLCDSQVCCLNFLFPFAENPAALKDLLHPIFPDIDQILPMEPGGPHLAFEWIGHRNYLNERMRGRQRTRGRYFTSADAAVMFLHANGSRRIVLIEWKYTESYGSRSLRTSPNGTDRTEIYAHLFEREDCPLDRSVISAFSDLFYDPFDQNMRQQFLAHEMERARELEADIVSLLHIEPRSNADLTAVTSPGLQGLGATSNDVWARLTAQSNRFARAHTEDLFNTGLVDRHPGLRRWWEYVSSRYAWLKTN